MTSGVTLYTTASATIRPTSRRTSSGNGGALAPRALVGDDVLDGVVDGQLRLPAGQLSYSGRVRLATAELLEALVVGLVVGHENDLRVGSGVVDDAPRELDDRHLGGRPDVED